jgi:2-polyprenyl-3-methyl-5-hydroxy-6-metoxy-1,4-benzoquinol methylase
MEDHNRAQIEYFERAGKRAMRPTASPYVDRQVDELVRFAGLTQGERVLDVGCGMGRYTFPLAERGFRVEGIDLSETLLDRLHSFNAGRYDIPLHCADIVDTPKGLDGAFDAMVGFFTLHHVHDLTAAFHAGARLVRPGGRVVFLEPNPLKPLFYLPMAVVPGMSWQGDKGILKMRPHTVFSAMASSGLTSLSMVRFGFFPPFLANRSWGSGLERALERLRFCQPFSAFQLFRGDRDLSPLGAL